MFCYIYADYFDLYAPGKLQRIAQGHIGPFQVTEGVLVGTSAVLAIPSVMIFLSVALKPTPNRWLNIVFGFLYTVIILLSMWGHAFMIVYGVIEITLTLLVMWYAWRWRPTPAAAPRLTDSTPNL